MYISVCLSVCLSLDIYRASREQQEEEERCSLSLLTTYDAVVLDLTSCESVRKSSACVGLYLMRIRGGGETKSSATDSHEVKSNTSWLQHTSRCHTQRHTRHTRHDYSEAPSGL